MDLDQLMWSLVLNGAFYLSCNKLTELCNNRICMPSAWRCSRYEPKCNEMLMLHISLHTLEGETRHLSAYTLSRRVCAKETDLSLLKLLGQMVNNKSASLPQMPTTDQLTPAWRPYQSTPPSLWSKETKAILVILVYTPCFIFPPRGTPYNGLCDLYDLYGEASPERGTSLFQPLVRGRDFTSWSILKLC